MNHTAGAMFLLACSLSVACVAGEADDLFARRIVPIAKSDRASSCSECHFAGVDLRQYVRADGPATFAALRADGMINVEKPAESKLLAFIRRHPEREDPLLAKVRLAELEAFEAWIAAAAKDPASLRAAPPAQRTGAPTPVEIIRHARKDRVLQSFIDNIWIERERCENCHSPDKNAQQVKKFGQRVSWISPGDPAGTLAKAVDQGIIDLDNPTESMLLTKPLGLVEHGGHKKFAVGSDSDKRFRRFLTDYVAVVRGTYQTAADLPRPPAERLFATGQQLKLTNLPPAWGDRLLRVDLYRWQGDRWSAHRAAFGESMVHAEKQVWQNLVFGVTTVGDPPAALEKRLLPAARYQARIYVDLGQRLAKERDYILGESDYVGAVEFSGEWKPGYQPPKTVTWAPASAAE